MAAEYLRAVVEDQMVLLFRLSGSALKPSWIITRRRCCIADEMRGRDRRLFGLEKGSPKQDAPSKTTRQSTKP